MRQNVSVMAITAFLGPHLSCLKLAIGRSVSQGPDYTHRTPKLECRSLPYSKTLKGDKKV